MKAYIDHNVLAELVEIMGDDMQMLVTSYISDTDEKVAILKAMDVVNESEEMYKLAHSIKGSSRNLGLRGFADYCEFIEKQARNSELTEQEFDRHKLEQLYQDSIKELKERYL